MHGAGSGDLHAAPVELRNVGPVACSSPSATASAYQRSRACSNECMTFLDDELSVITGPYDNLLSINDVIDNELILFVSLNINKNAAPVKALGKMMLQNLQLVVGKRYETETERKRRNKPLFSVVMDEFAPFGYSNFCADPEHGARHEHGVPVLPAIPSAIA